MAFLKGQFGIGSLELAVEAVWSWQFGVGSLE